MAKRLFTLFLLLQVYSLFSTAHAQDPQARQNDQTSEGNPSNALNTQAFQTTNQAMLEIVDLLKSKSTLDQVHQQSLLKILAQTRKDAKSSVAKTNENLRAYFQLMIVTVNSSRNQKLKDNPKFTQEIEEAKNLVTQFKSSSVNPDVANLMLSFAMADIKRYETLRSGSLIEELFKKARQIFEKKQDPIAMDRWLDFYKKSATDFRVTLLRRILLSNSDFFVVNRETDVGTKWWHKIHFSEFELFGIAQDIENLKKEIENQDISSMDNFVLEALDLNKVKTVSYLARSNKLSLEGKKNLAFETARKTNLLSIHARNIIDDLINSNPSHRQDILEKSMAGAASVGAMDLVRYYATMPDTTPKMLEIGLIWAIRFTNFDIVKYLAVRSSMSSAVLLEGLSEAIEKASAHDKWDVVEYLVLRKKPSVSDLRTAYDKIEPEDQLRIVPKNIKFLLDASEGNQVSFEKEMTDTDIRLEFRRAAVQSAFDHSNVDILVSCLRSNDTRFRHGVGQVTGLSDIEIDRIAKSIRLGQIDQAKVRIGEKVTGQTDGVEKFKVVQRWNEAFSQYKIRSAEDFQDRFQNLISTTSTFSRMTPDEALEILADQWNRLHQFISSHSDFLGDQTVSPSLLTTNWARLARNVPGLLRGKRQINSLHIIAKIGDDSNKVNNKKNGQDLLSEINQDKNPYQKLLIDYRASIETAQKNSFIPDIDMDKIYRLMHQAQVWLVEHTQASSNQITNAYVDAIKVGDVDFMKKYDGDKRVDLNVLRSILSNSLTPLDVILTKITNRKAISAKSSDPYKELFDQITHFPGIAEDDEFIRNLYVQTMNPYLEGDERLNTDAIDEAYLNAFHSTDKPLVTTFSDTGILDDESYVELFNRAIDHLITADIDALENNKDIDVRTRENGLIKVVSMYADAYKNNDFIKLGRTQLLIQQLFGDIKDSINQPSNDDYRFLWKAIASSMDPEATNQLRAIFDDKTFKDELYTNTFQGKTVGELRQIVSSRDPHIMSRVLGVKFHNITDLSPVTRDAIRGVFFYAIRNHNTNLMNRIRHHAFIDSKTYNDGYTLALEEGSGDMVYDMRQDSRISEANRYETLITLLTNRELTAQMLWSHQFRDFENQTIPETKRSYIGKLKEKVYANTSKIQPTDNYIQILLSLGITNATEYVNQVAQWIKNATQPNPDLITGKYVKAVERGDYKTIEKYTSEVGVDLTVVQNILRHSNQKDDVILSEYKKGQARDKKYFDLYDLVFNRVTKFHGITNEFLQAVYFETLNSRLRDDARVGEDVVRKAYENAFANTDKPLSITFRDTKILTNDEAVRLYHRSIQKLILEDFQELSRYPSVKPEMIRRSLDEVAAVYSTTKDEKVKDEAARMISELVWKFGESVKLPSSSHVQDMWAVLKIKYGPRLYQKLHDLLENSGAASDRIPTFNGETIEDLRNVFAYKLTDFYSFIGESIFGHKTNNSPISEDDVRKALHHAAIIGDRNAFASLKKNPAIDPDDFNEAYYEALTNNQAEIIVDSQSDQRLSDENKFITVQKLAMDHEFVSEMNVFTTPDHLMYGVDPGLTAETADQIKSTSSAYASFLLDVFAQCDHHSPDYFNLMIEHTQTDRGLIQILDAATAHAIATQKYQVLESILKNPKISADIVNSVNNQNKSNLFIATVFGDQNVIKLYLQHPGIGVNSVNGRANPRTLIETAVLNNNALSYEFFSIVQYSDIYSQLSGQIKWVSVFNRNNLIFVDGKPPTNWHNSKVEKGVESQNRENRDRIAEMFWFHPKTNSFSKTSIAPPTRENIVTDLDVATAAHLYDKFSNIGPQTNGLSLKDISNFANYVLRNTFDQNGKGDEPIYRKTPDEKTIRGFLYSASGPNRTDFNQYLNQFAFDDVTTKDALAILLLTPVKGNKPIRLAMLEDFLNSGEMSDKMINERFVAILNEMVKRPDLISPDVLNARVRSIIATDQFTFTTWEKLLPKLDTDNTLRLLFVLDARDKYVTEINDQLSDEQVKPNQPINLVVKTLGLNEAIKLKQVEAVKAIRKSLDVSHDRQFAKIIRRKYAELAEYYSRNPTLLKRSNLEIMNLLSYAITSNDLIHIRDQVFSFLRESLPTNVATMITGHIEKQSTNTRSFKYRPKGEDLSQEKAELKAITNHVQGRSPPIEVTSEYLKSWQAVSSYEPLDVGLWLADLGDTWVDLLKTKVTKDNAEKIYHEMLEDIVLRVNSNGKASDIYSKKITYEDAAKQLSKEGLGKVVVFETAMETLSKTQHHFIDDLYNTQRNQISTNVATLDLGIISYMKNTVKSFLKDHLGNVGVGVVGNLVIKQALKKDVIGNPRVLRRGGSRQNKDKSTVKLSAPPKVTKDFTEAVNNRKVNEVSRLLNKYSFDQKILADAFANLISRETNNKNREETLQALMSTSELNSESINKMYEKQILHDADGLVIATLPDFSESLSPKNVKNSQYIQLAKIGKVVIVDSLLDDENISDAMKVKIIDILLHNARKDDLQVSAESDSIRNFFEQHSEAFLANNGEKFEIALDFVKSIKLLAENKNAYDILIVHNNINSQPKAMKNFQADHPKEFNLLQEAHKIYSLGYESPEIIAKIIAFDQQIQQLQSLDIDPTSVPLRNLQKQKLDVQIDYFKNQIAKVDGRLNHISKNQEVEFHRVLAVSSEVNKLNRFDSDREKYISEFKQTLFENEPIEFKALLKSMPVDLKLDHLFQGRLIFLTTVHAIETREYGNLQVLLGDTDISPNYLDEHNVTGLALASIAADDIAVKLYLSHSPTDTNLLSIDDSIGFSALDAAFYNEEHANQLARQFGLNISVVQSNRTAGKVEILSKLLWNDSRTTAVTHGLALGKYKQFKNQDLVSQFIGTLDIKHSGSYELQKIFPTDQAELSVVEVFKQMLGLDEAATRLDQGLEHSIVQKDQAAVHARVAKFTPGQLSYEVGRAVFAGNSFYLAELLRNPYVDLNMIKYSIIYTKCNPPSYILTNGMYVKRDSNQDLLNILIPALPRETQDEFMKSTMVTSLENASTVEQYRKVLHQFYPKNLIHDVSYNYIHATYYLDYLINQKITDVSAILPMIEYFEEVHHMAPIANVGNWNAIFPRMIELKGAILARHVLDEINTHPEKYPELQKMFADLTTEQTEQILDLYSNDKNDIKKLNHLETVLKTVQKETVLQAYFGGFKNVGDNENATGGTKENREYRNADGLKAPTFKEIVSGTQPEKTGVGTWGNTSKTKPVVNVSSKTLDVDVGGKTVAAHVKAFQASMEEIALEETTKAKDAKLASKKETLLSLEQELGQTQSGRSQLVSYLVSVQMRAKQEMTRGMVQEFPKFLLGSTLAQLWIASTDPKVPAQDFLSWLSSIPQEFFRNAQFALGNTVGTTAFDLLMPMVKGKLMQEYVDVTAERVMVEAGRGTLLQSLRNKTTAYEFARGQVGMFVATLLNVLFEPNLTMKQKMEETAKTQVSFLLSDMLIRNVVIPGITASETAAEVLNGIRMTEVSDPMVGAVIFAATLVTQNKIETYMTEQIENAKVQKHLGDALVTWVQTKDETSFNKVQTNLSLYWNTMVSRDIQKIVQKYELEQDQADQRGEAKIGMKDIFSAVTGPVGIANLVTKANVKGLELTVGERGFPRVDQPTYGQSNANRFANYLQDVNATEKAILRTIEPIHFKAVTMLTNSQQAQETARVRCASDVKTCVNQSPGVISQAMGYQNRWLQEGGTILRSAADVSPLTYLQNFSLLPKMITAQEYVKLVLALAKMAPEDQRSKLITMLAGILQQQVHAYPTQEQFALASTRYAEAHYESQTKPYLQESMIDAENGSSSQLGLRDAPMLMVVPQNATPQQMQQQVFETLIKLATIQAWTHASGHQLIQALLDYEKKAQTTGGQAQKNRMNQSRAAILQGMKQSGDKWYYLQDHTEKNAHTFDHELLLEVGQELPTARLQTTPYVHYLYTVPVQTKLLQQYQQYVR